METIYIINKESKKARGILSTIQLEAIQSSTHTIVIVIRTVEFKK